MNIDKHPKYIKSRLKNIPENQFGNSLFGLVDKNKNVNLSKLKQAYKNYIKNYLLVK
jgi:hypothetical protein